VTGGDGGAVPAEAVATGGDGGAVPAEAVVTGVDGGAVTVLVPGALRSEVDGQSRLALPARATLGEVLDELRSRWPRLERRLRDERGDLRRYVNVYVDGEDCRMIGGLTAVVRPGTEVQVIPSVAGG
jgi:molybdopterin converting factor small subunit